MNSLILLGVLAGVGVSAAADFPADTLLPSRWVEAGAASQAVSAEVRYDYARDARDWLYATMTWTYAETDRIRVDVAITDRAGRYRGGSRMRTGNSLITYEPVYGPEGRMDRRILRMDSLVAVEHYEYDDHGNAVGKITLSGGDTTEIESYPHTYDGEGRISTRKDYDRDSLNSTQVFRYDAQGRLAALIEYGNPWVLRDSTVYAYRPDGRLLRESRYGQPGGAPREIVTWEYRVWQVPLALVRPARPAPGSLAGYPAGKAFDPLGRALARPPSGGFPRFLRP